MPTTEQLQQWLDECEAAVHELALGCKAVSVSSGTGKSVSFTPASIGLLRERIRELRRALGQPVGRAATFQIGGH